MQVCWEKFEGMKMKKIQLHAAIYVYEAFAEEARSN